MWFHRRICCTAAALFVLSFLVLLAVPALAQAPSATLFIAARSDSGSRLPGVVVTLTNQDTGVSREGTTSEAGTMVVPLVPAGTYTLRAALDGFKTEVVTDLRIQAAVKGTLDLVMVPGQFSEEIVVSADLTTLRAGNGAVGEVFEGQTLITLPVTDRDALQFSLLAPGVAPPAPGSRLSTQGNTGINSSGARESSNNFLIEGIDNNDLFLNRLVVSPSLDAIEQVSFLQNTYDAEYGRSGGAQVNVVLKSGTRDLHGSAYNFFRTSALDARQVFEPRDTPKAGLRKNQFGGTLGGQVGQLPSFFFVSVEGIEAVEAETRLARVPTAAERDGDFSASGGARDPFTGRPFAGGVIPASRISPVSRAVLGLYPLPNRDGAQANFVASPEGERNAVQVTIKTDHNYSPARPFSVRYSFSRDDRDLPFPAHGRNLPGFGVSVLDQGQNGAASFKQAFSSRVFNELRVGFNTLRRDNLPQSSGIDRFAELGIVTPPVDTVDLGYPRIILPGYESLGDDANLPVARTTRTLHLSESLTFDTGRHHVKVGTELRHYKSDGFNHVFSRGQTSFTGAFTQQPLGDLLLGYPTFSLLGVNDNRQALRTSSINLFAQDDWRLSSRVTLSAGIRYEYNAPPTDPENRMRTFDFDTLQLVQVGSGGVPRSGLNKDLNNFAPRLGVSWDLTGTGAWMLRGGYGVFYDSGTLIENSALYFNPPYFALSLFFPGQQLLTIDNPFPSDRGVASSLPVNTLDRDMRTAYSHQASLGLERVFAGATVTARYVTTQGRNLVRKRNVNQPPPGPGELDPRRPIQGWGDILLVESAAESSYHAMQLAVVKRATRDLSWRASYTWGKSMDDTSAFLASDGNDNTPQDSRNIDAEWSLSDFDVRHRLVLAGTWNIPFPDTSVLLRDWQVSGIFSAQSGRPFTPRVSFDNSNTGNVGGGTFAYDRPNVVTGAVPPGTDVVSYDGQQFAVAPAFTFGNAGRNSLIGPGYVTLDGVLSRRLRFGNARALELRLEVFNVLNRENYALPDTFVDRPTFGQSLAAFAPRRMQLAARYSF